MLVLTRCAGGSRRRLIGQAAYYLLEPDIVLERLWALPDHTMHGLGDAENFI
jgi:hypothetical protein